MKTHTCTCTHFTHTPSRSKTYISGTHAVADIHSYKTLFTSESGTSASYLTHVEPPGALTSESGTSASYLTHVELPGVSLEHHVTVVE